MPPQRSDDESLPRLLREFHKAAGDERLMTARPHVLVAAREAARWLRVSAPTAAKLLRAAGMISEGTGRGARRGIPLAALADMATPTPYPPLPLRVVVAQPAQVWPRAAVASGLAQGLGLTGHRTLLVEGTPGGQIRTQFGAAWPRTRLADAGSEPDELGLFAVITEVPADLSPALRSAVVEADLVLVPYPTTTRGMQSAVFVLEQLEHNPAKRNRRIRLLPWGPGRPIADATGVRAAFSWRGLPDLAALESAGATLPPLAAMPAIVPVRLALAFRVALAKLTWNVVDFASGKAL